MKYPKSLIALSIFKAKYMLGNRYICICYYRWVNTWHTYISVYMYVSFPLIQHDPSKQQQKVIGNQPKSSQWQKLEQFEQQNK